MEFDLFKNQVRFKIALELIDIDEGLSILQLNKLLKEVSQATLYRHVNSMVEDDLLKVVGGWINRVHVTGQQKLHGRFRPYGEVEVPAVLKLDFPPARIHRGHWCRLRKGQGAG